MIGMVEELNSIYRSVTGRARGQWPITVDVYHLTEFLIIRSDPADSEAGSDTKYALGKQTWRPIVLLSAKVEQTFTDRSDGKREWWFAQPRGRGHERLPTREGAGAW